MCAWTACTTATNGLPNPNERMPRTGMCWVPRSLFLCPTRLAVFLLGRKDLRALGALRIDDNQAFTTANRAFIGADENFGEPQPSCPGRRSRFCARFRWFSGLRTIELS